MKTIIAFLVLASTFAHSEVVRGTANVWDDNKRDVVAQLQDGAVISADSKLHGWYRVAFRIQADVADFRPDSDTLMKGARLFDMSGKPIGQMLSDMEVPTYGVESGLRAGVIEAVQIPEANIDSSSDIDRQFIDIIASSSSLRQTSFRIHFTKYQYDRWIDSSGFRTFILYGAAGESSPTVRNLSIFYDHRLFAVIHSGELDFPKRRRMGSIREFHITYFSNDSRVIQKFGRIYFPIIQAAD